ncbi:MAG TPA: D-alanyl-D-alanine carboxypeptidase/D-alanyl-D-alanine-endopeptidase, partial [Sphingomicrobium sp.]|nr:D-alanyl-D-alanine carboxypeptidase/D-alanyl-D-alanine-endopeptidase [Sphingomicrobium sp.]
MLAVLQPVIAVGLPTPARAEAVAQSLQQRVEAKLREAGPGTRFGLVVATQDGHELVAIAPDGRFIPASNTKIFTTAAVFELLGGLHSPDASAGAFVRLRQAARGGPDVELVGLGDARMSSAPDCVANCLAQLADAVAAKVRVVRDVIGDDTYFPDERWSPGMSWNNIPTRSGTAVSALTVDDNELALRVTPGRPGERPEAEIGAYYSVDNRAVTVGEGKADLTVDRLPGSSVVRLTGIIPAGSDTQLVRLGIDDPAHYAAWRLKGMLEERGVRVTGAVEARHRPAVPSKYALADASPDAAGSGPDALVRTTPGPLAEDLRLTNKVSHNVHAELLLRRVGRKQGTGSIADGLDATRAMIERAGVARWAYDLFDGSGMSTYNRASPRGTVTFLRWIAGRPWGAEWRATLPVGGVDGTLG